MAMMVSDEVRTMFQVLTGEEWPDANETDLRALADAWERAAIQLSAELAPELRQAVTTIRSTFAGEAELAFAARMSPFVEGTDNHIGVADTQFRQLAKFLRDLALDVEYVKLVSIITLVTLIAEIAWATAMAFWTAGSSMAWLAARMAIVRVLLKTLLGRLLIRFAQAAVFGVVFQLAVDALAQAIQFGSGHRTQWNTDHTKNAAAVGALGGALAVPLAGIGKVISSLSAGGLDKIFGKVAGGRDWHKDLPEVITEIGMESFQETLTEATYKYITEGEFDMNPFAASSGAVSGAAGAGGTELGNHLATPKPGKDSDTGGSTSEHGTQTDPDPTSGDPDPIPTTASTTPPASTPPASTPPAGTPPSTTPVAATATSGGQNRGTSTGDGPDPTTRDASSPAPGGTQVGGVAPESNRPAPSVSGGRGGLDPSRPGTAPTTADPTVVPSPVSPAPAGQAPGGSQSGERPGSQQAGTGASGRSGPGPQTTTAPGPVQAPATTSGGPVAPAPGTPASGPAPGSPEQPVTQPSVTPPASPEPRPASMPENGTGTANHGSAEEPATAQAGGSPTAEPQAHGSPERVEATAETTAPPAEPTIRTAQENTAAAEATTAGETGSTLADSSTTDNPSVRPEATESAVDSTGPVGSPSAVWGTDAIGARPEPSSSGSVPNLTSGPTTPPTGATTARATGGPTPSAGGSHRPSLLGGFVPLRRLRPSSSRPTAPLPSTGLGGQAGTRESGEGSGTLPSTQSSTVLPSTLPESPPQPSGASATATAGSPTSVDGSSTVRTPANTDIQNTEIQNTEIQTNEIQTNDIDNGDTQNTDEGDGGDRYDGSDTSRLSETDLDDNVDVQRAQAAAEAAAVARDGTAVLVGESRYRTRQTEAAAAAVDGHVRTAEGAVRGTTTAAIAARAALTAAQHRVDQSYLALRTAETAFTRVDGDATRLRGQAQAAELAVTAAEEALTRAAGTPREEQATTAVAEAREVHTAAEVAAARAETARTLADTARAGAVTAHAEARQGRDRARAALDLVRASATAAGQAARTAHAARTDASRAHQDARTAHAAIGAARTTANTAAHDAAQAARRTRNAVADAHTARRAADTARASADRAARTHRDRIGDRARVQERITTAEAGVVAIDTRLAEIAAALTTEGQSNGQTAPTPPQSQSDGQSAGAGIDAAALRAEQETLRTDRADLDSELAEHRRERDRIDEELPVRRQTEIDTARSARAAERNADAADRQVTAAVADAESARTAAQGARTAAGTAAGRAGRAATEADTAKTDAETAAKQGEAERAVTLLTGLPLGSRVEIQHVGPRTALGDVIATLVPAATRADVQTAVDGLSTEELAVIVNQGGLLTVPTPAGPVGVTLTGEVRRPADTRTKEAVTGRPQAHPSTSTSRAAETQTPLTESVSSSLPLRVPLFSAVPIADATPLLRPFVFVGATGKRAQTSGSTSAVKSGTKNGDRTMVRTDLAITASLPSGDGVAAVVGVRLTVPDTVAAQPQTVAVTAAMLGDLAADGVTVPDSLADEITTHTGGGRQEVAALLGSAATLLAPVGTLDKGTRVGTQDVRVTDDGGPQATLVGTANTGTSARAGHTSTGGVTRGSEATAGAGFYGGKNLARFGWFLGVFTDFTTGLTGGTSRQIEQGVDRGATETELVYRLDRPVQVHIDGQDQPVTGTVSGSVTVPVELARSLGLPLPPHLSGATPRAAGQRGYLLGTDDIKSVPGAAAIAAGVNHQLALDPTGSAAVTARFTGPKAVRAVYNALYGGEQVTWTEGGLVHTVDIHAVLRPPASTVPSGQTKLSVADQTNTQAKRAVTANRSARVGAGFEFRPTGKDSPNPTPAPPPEKGNPDPYQGGPTTSGAGPRAVAAFAWENSRGTSVAVTARDARGGSHTGEIRRFDGAVDLVVVHRSVATPNWFQRFFLGGKMTLGPKADARLTEPDRADVDRLLAGLPPHTPTANLRSFSVEGAVRVAVPADKLDWADSGVAPSGMNPGVYLAPPPALPAGVRQVDPRVFGDFAAVEHVRVTTNTTEGVHIALAKSVEPTDPRLRGDPATPQRKSPVGAGMWPSWGRRDLADTRPAPAGGTRTTGYRYKLSELSRNGTTAGETVREFIGEVGSRGTAALGLDGLHGGTAAMVQPGRLTDFNGTLDAVAEYSSPRLVDVRPEGTLQRSQSADRAVNTSLSKSKGYDVEGNLDVLPRRSNRWGARLRLTVGGGQRWTGNDAEELSAGGKQAYEYKGPTAWVALDVRYRYSAEMNIRNALKTNKFGQLPVVVDQPDGVLVQMPVANAIDLFQSAGLPVPPELTAAAPEAATAVTPAPTLLTGEYASYSQTTVIRSGLHGPDPLAGVGDRLAELGVDGKWRTEVLTQVGDLLSTPRGHVLLRDVLAGDDGRISVSDFGAVHEDVIDIRVTATPAVRPSQAPAATPLAPDSQATSGSGGRSDTRETGTSGQISAGFQVDAVNRTTPSTPPAPLGPDGKPERVAPNPGARFGFFGLLPGISRGTSRTVTDPDSGGVKPTRQLKVDKVGRVTREVDYHLEISRFRRPLPGVDALLGPVVRSVNLDRTGGEPVTVGGAVDLVAPSAAVSPPLTTPAQPPTITVVAQRPPRGSALRPEAMWHVEAMGRATARAIRDAGFTALSDAPARTGQVTAAQIDAARADPSDHTRRGGIGEYALHSVTAGSALHNGAYTIFTSDDYRVDDVVSRKHTTYDALYDIKVTADFRPGSFRFVAASPDDVKTDMESEVENSRKHGESRTVRWGGSLTTPGVGGTTVGGTTAGPAAVGSAPGVGADSGITDTTATAGSRSESTSAAQGGRSYLFTADADFYVETRKHHSNRVTQAVASLADKLPGRGRGSTSVTRVGSTGDIAVRVWEADALREGLLTLGDIWQHHAKTPGPGLATRPTQDGAVLHNPAHTAPNPAPVAPAAPDARGRTLHIGPGVTLDQVRGFVGSLPAEMRPDNYTVAPGQPYGAPDVERAVAGIDAPAATPQTWTPNEVRGAASVARAALATAAPTAVAGVDAPVRAGMATAFDPAALGALEADVRAVLTEDAHRNGIEHARALAGELARDLGAARPVPTGSIAGLATVPAALPVPAAAESTGESIGESIGESTMKSTVEQPVGGRSSRKRGRDEFEADGPVTEQAPRSARPLPERLVPPTPGETAALLDAVPPGTRFSDPAKWVGLVNGNRSAEGRAVNCLDAALAFHDTYNGAPRAAGSAATGAPPTGAGTAAGEATSYAPELIGAGAPALAEVIERVTRGGHGTDAILIGFRDRGPGHAWNVVNHHGVVSLVDAQAGTLVPASPTAITGLARVYAIPIDADGAFIAPAPAVPAPPAGLSPDLVAEFTRLAGSPQPDWLGHLETLDSRAATATGDERAATVLHARDVDTHRMRADLAAGRATPLRGAPAGIVPGIDGLRVVGSAVAAWLAADLAAVLGRDVIALVVGSDGEEPRELRFPPRGRPLPTSL